MLKHKGFPSRLPSSDFQFTIRRANPKGVTPLVARERYADRRPAEERRRVRNSELSSSTSFRP